MKHDHYVIIVYALIGIQFVMLICSLDTNFYILGADNNPRSKTASCQNICKLNQFPNQTVEDFTSFSLDNSDVLFVHFNGNKSLLGLEHSAENTDILDPVNLVWVESITAPFLSLDLGFNVYSLTTLWRKVRNMSVKVDFESSKCLHNISYSCMAASLATAFLTNVSHQRGALCYVIKAKSAKYRCCIRDFHTDEIKCDVPAPISLRISGIFNAVAIVGTIFCLCFPAIFFSFPDKDDISETLSANTQIRNPLYRIANFIVQKIQLYSAKYYLANMVRKLLIGFSLPILFYVDWGLVVYTAKYDIPKMFNNAVRQNWQEKNHLELAELSVILYSILVIITSLLKRSENLDLSHLPEKANEKLKDYQSDINVARDHILSWMIPYSYSKKSLMIFCFGFKKEESNRQTSTCWRITKFVFSCFLILIFPFIAILIFIGYGCFKSPLGRKYTILYINALIYYDWATWNLEDILKIEQYPNVSRAAICGVLLIFCLVSFFIRNMIYRSLILISRFIVYLYMGIVVSKDDALPIIAIFSLFVYYIRDCFSSVENTYKDLLDQTFDKCKEYQDEANRQVIEMDNKTEVPRIKRLSDLFQKVVNEIQPFSRAYTIMCLKIVIIGCFLCLTYYSILVYGNTSLSDLAKTLAVSLAGLIPKLIEIFRTGTPKELIDKENSYIVKKIVHDFFRDTENTHAVKEVAIQTEINALCNNTQSGVEVSEDSAENQSDNQSPSSSPEQQRHHQLVHADVNPRLENINNDDTSTEMTSLLQSHQNSSRDQRKDETKV